MKITSETLNKLDLSKMNQTEEDLSLIYTNLSEHSHQVELFAWAAVAGLYGLDTANMWVSTHPLHAKRTAPAKLGLECDEANGEPRLRWLHSIPNGGSRGSDKLGAQITGARMKAEGVKRGVPDIFLPLPLNGLCGLYIELKKANGKLSNLTKEQKEFAEYSRLNGYGWSVCFGYMQAINCLTSYLSDPVPK